MSLHAFGLDRLVPAPSGSGLAPRPVASDCPGTPESRSFAVRVRFGTTAARAAGFEIVAAEARVGVPVGAERLTWVAEAADRDLLIRVEGAADPDAAIGVATEALRESLVTFRVAAIERPERVVDLVI